MGGIVGRFFNEFAIVLSIAILISLVVSLTTTPMMCAYLDLHKPERDRLAAARFRACFPERIARSTTAPCSGRSPIPASS